MSSGHLKEDFDMSESGRVKVRLIQRVDPLNNRQVSVIAAKKGTSPMILPHLSIFCHLNLQEIQTS